MLTKHTLFKTKDVQKSENSVFKSSEEIFSKANPVQFVGQEQDGTLLFTWEDFPPGTEEGLTVTYIGAYNPYRNTMRAVFAYNYKINIVSATINRTHTFIGFVSYETVERTGAHGRIQPQGMYKAFIAEIQPQNRTFYLNLERENCIKLQFVYGSYRSSSSPGTSPREDHLLVFLHKESIGLYHLPIGRFGDEVIMSGEPRKEQLFHRRFVWVEWDSANQRLYIVHFLKSGKNERGQTVHQPYLKCYQFTLPDGPMYTHHRDKELVLDMALDLPVPFLKDSIYLDIAPYQGIPDSAINMKVLSQPNGGLCLCFQHNMAKKLKEDPSDFTTLQYSIYLIHKDKALHGLCAKIPFKVAVNARLFFSLLDGYILVHLPGYVTHLLSVGTEYDPGMNILYEGRGDAESGHMISYIADRETIHNTGACFYDVEQREAFRFTLDTDVLVDMFETCSQLECKVAILHYAVVQTRNLVLMKSLIASVCKTPSDLDTVSLFQEFLVGYTYSQLRRHLVAVEKKILTYIPYTCHDHVEKHAKYQLRQKPCVESTVSYSSHPEVTLLGDKSESYSTDFWQFLADQRTAAMSAQSQGNSDQKAKVSSQGHRFDLMLAKLDEDQNQETSKKTTSSLGPADTPSIFKKISEGVRSAFGRDTSSKSPVTAHQSLPKVIRTSSRIDAVLGRLPPFLTKEEDGYKSHRYYSKTVELLSIHLIQFNKRVSRTKIRNISEEYVKCQWSSCRLLCHVIWSVMGDGQHSEEGHLAQRGDDREVALLKALERLMVASEVLGFPLISGLSDFLLSLSFRCVPLHTFLQYVDQGVYSLTPQFVLQALDDIPDTGDNLQRKWHLVHRLPEDCAVQCLRHWDHPSAIQAVSQYYAEMIITKQAALDVNASLLTSKKISHGNNSTQHDPHITEHDSFPPALTFIKYLQRKDNGLSSSDGSTFLEVDTEYLKSAALVYMSS